MKRKIKRPSLADLIFNDRNKNYGAFSILKNSVRRLRISFFSATGIFLLLILVIGGGIWLPWFNYSSSDYVYSVVNVKYDPSLITILSEPQNVTPKEEKKKVFTEPKIVDEENEAVAVEKLKPAEEIPVADTSAGEVLKDNMNATASENEDNKLHLKTSKADSVVFVEQLPQFPGGPAALKYFISNNLKYPVDAIIRKVQGTVILSFIVEKDGSIRRIIITKAVDPVVDFEAVRVISSMPLWLPAKMKGKPVATMIVIPINFSLRP